MSSAAAEATTFRYTRRRRDFSTPSRLCPHGEHGRSVHQPQRVTQPEEDVVMHRDSTPKRGNSPSRNADAVEAIPDSKKTRHIAKSPGLCGEHWILLPDRWALRGTRTDIEHSPTNDQKDSDKEEPEYVLPELLARTHSHPIFGARSGLLVDPETRQHRTANGA